MSESDAVEEREFHRLLFGEYPEMTDREALEAIVDAWAEKHGADGSLVPLYDDLWAAGWRPPGDAPAVQVLTGPSPVVGVGDAPRTDCYECGSILMGLYCPKCEGHVAAARREALEECAALRCSDCRDGAPSRNRGDKWVHEFRDEQWNCEASDIRALIDQPAPPAEPGLPDVDVLAAYSKGRAEGEAAARREALEDCRRAACQGCAEHWPLEATASGEKHRKPFSMGYTYVRCHAEAIRALIDQPAPPAPSLAHGMADATLRIAELRALCAMLYDALANLRVLAKNTGTPESKRLAEQQADDALKAAEDAGVKP